MRKETACRGEDRAEEGSPSSMRLTTGRERIDMGEVGSKRTKEAEPRGLPKWMEIKDPDHLTVNEKKRIIHHANKQVEAAEAACMKNKSLGAKCIFWGNSNQDLAVAKAIAAH
eukprot:747576-Hanusia_phi.AAC.1